MTWMELEYFLPGLSKMQQCPEKTIQLEPFCYPNQKTKQGIFDKKKVLLGHATNNKQLIFLILCFQKFDMCKSFFFP